MKRQFILRIIRKFKFLFLMLILVNFLFVFCSEDAKLWEVKSQDQVAADYIKSHPEQFSEFAKLIDLTGLDALLRIRGPYTIMLPTDEAMQNYYKLKNVNSLNDFSPEFRSQLIRNHLITNEIATGDIGLGALRDTNAIGDYLVTEFRGSDIILNKASKIIKRDISTANGYIQVIDKVIDPLVNDIFVELSSNPSYKIFSEGLKVTGIKDTLQIISFPFGKRKARTRFTLLAVADSIYNRYGINNVNDLINWTGANPDSIKYIDNPFYRYIEYHCLNGSYFLSDFNSGIYSILSHDNNVAMTVDNDYKINLNSSTGKYTGFNIEESNYPAKNGAIHSIKGLLPVIDPEPAIIVFETTDYFDLQQGDYVGKYYMKWSDGQNTFEKIKFQGDYLLYYYKQNHGRSAILNYDCLSMLGFWWIEITTPKIMKGHYAVSANIWTGGEDLPIFDAYLDGVKVASINARISGTKMDFGEVNWTKTEEHKVKLVCTGWGTLFWDSVIFTPIKQ